MNIQTKYFILAVIIFGSTGIWLSIGIEALVDHKITLHYIPQNVTTYFISILFAGSIDYFLNKIRIVSIEGVASAFLNVIILHTLGILLVLGAVILYVLKFDWTSLIIGIIGVLISYRIWWIANINNPNFTSNTASLGGDVTKTLQNGK